MNLIEVEAECFKSLGVKKKFRFRFPKTCLAVKGKNESGKSSFTELILFCIFGKKFSTDTKVRTLDDFLTRGKNRCRCRLVFEVEGRRYEICRELKRTSSSVIQDPPKVILKDITDSVEGNVLATKVQPVYDQMIKLIKIDMNTMLSSNFVGQKEVDAISKMDHEDWKKTINKILNLESFTKSIADLKENRTDVLIPDLNAETTTLQALQVEMTSIGEKIGNIIDLTRQKNGITKEIATIDAELRQYDYYEGNKAIHETLTASIASIKDKNYQRDIATQRLDDALAKEELQLDAKNELAGLSDMSRVEVFHDALMTGNKLRVKNKELVSKLEFLGNDVDTIARIHEENLAENSNVVDTITVDEAGVSIARATISVGDLDGSGLNDLQAQKTRLERLANSVSQEMDVYQGLLQERDDLENKQARANELADVPDIMALNDALDLLLQDRSANVEKQERLSQDLETINADKTSLAAVQVKLAEMQGIDADGVTASKCLDLEAELKTSHDSKATHEAAITAALNEIHALKADYKVLKRIDDSAGFQQKQAELQAMVDAGISFKNPMLARFIIPYGLTFLGIGIAGFLLMLVSMYAIIAGIAGMALLVIGIAKVWLALGISKEMLDVTSKINEKYAAIEQSKVDVAVMDNAISRQENAMRGLHDQFSPAIDVNARLPVADGTPISFEVIQAKNQAIREAISALKAKRDRLRDDEEKLQASVDRESGVVASLDDCTSHVEALDHDIKATLSKYPDRYKSLHNETRFDIQDVQVGLMAAKNTAARETSELATLNSDIERLQRDVDTIPDVEASLATGMATFNVLERGLLKNISDLTAVLATSIASTIALLNRLLEELPYRYGIHAPVPETRLEPSIASIKKTLDTERARSQSLEKTIEDLQPAVESIPALKADLDTILGHLSAAWSACETEGAGLLGPSAGLLSGVGREVNLYEQQLSVLNDSLKKVEGIVADLNDQRSKKEGTWMTLKQQKAALYDDLVLADEEKTPEKFFASRAKKQELEYKINVCKKAEDVLELVNNLIINNQIPMVERSMGEYMSDITDNKYWRFKIQPPPAEGRKKTYDYLVYEAQTGQDVLIDRMSGGTEDQVMLALRLAFGMSLLPRAGASAPRFLVLDEVFGSSDFERRENIITLIREKMNQYYDQIIVITHEKDVIENIPYYIEMENGQIVDQHLPED